MRGTARATWLLMCARSESRTILVVEDDAAIRLFYEELLQDAGYHVLSAETGQQARALVAIQPVAGVLLDNRLPDTSGVGLCREFRATLGSRVPIMLLTADREAGLEASAFAAGATGFLHKPFDPDVLPALLVAYVPASSAQDT